MRKCAGVGLYKEQPEQKVIIISTDTTEQKMESGTPKQLAQRDNNMAAKIHSDLTA